MKMTRQRVVESIERYLAEVPEPEDHVPAMGLAATIDPDKPENIVKLLQEGQYALMSRAMLVEILEHLGGSLTLRKRAFALANENDLTRDERLEFASMLLKQDLASWKELDDEDCQRLVDAMEGSHLLDVLKSQRG